MEELLSLIIIFFWGGDGRRVQWLSIKRLNAKANPLPLIYFEGFSHYSLKKLMHIQSV